MSADLPTTEPGPDEVDAFTGGSIGKHVVSGVFWSVIQSWGGRLISTAVFVVIGRLLSPEDFGLVSLGTIVVELGALLTVSGFHRALVQRKILEAEHLDAAFWSSVVIGTFLCVVSMLVAGPIANLLDEPAFAPILRALSLTFLITAFGAVPYALLHRRLAFRTFAIRQLTAITVGGSVGVTLAVSGAGPWALVGQALSSSLTGAVVVWINAGWRPRLRFSSRHWRDIARFGTVALVIDMLDLANARLDDLLIGVALGSTALGYYSIAYRTYAISLEVVAYSLGAVAFPLFSRIVADRARGGRAVIRATRFVMCVTLPVFLGLAVVADHAVVGLFGPQWSDSVPVLRILAVAAAIGSTVMMSRDVVMAAGRPRLELGKMLIIGVATFIAFFIGVSWGLVGVAWGRVAVSLVIVPVGVYGIRRVVEADLRAYLLACIGPLPACAVMVAVVWYADRALAPDRGSLIWLGLLGALGLVVYVATPTLTARSTVKELVGLVRDRGAP